MEIYKLTPLTSLVWFQEGPGVRNTQYTNSGVKLLNVANLIDGHIDLSTSNRYIAEEEAYGRYRHFLCDKGDLVIASSGIKVDYFDKKMGFVRQEHLPLCMNTSTIRFKVLDKNILNIRYFMYFLKSNFFKSQLSKQITGSAQLNFGPSHLKRMIVPLINIDYQNHICGILDKVYELEYKLQTELTLLNQLVKSRFLERFGDPIINPFGYPIHKLGDYIENLTSGARGWARYYADDGNAWFITIKNVKNCKITVDNMQTINAPDNAEAKRTRVKEGDLLISITADLGRTGVVTKEIANKGSYINQHLSCIRLNRYALEPLYVAYFMESEAGKRQFKKENQSAVKAGINFKSIQSLKLMVPPLVRQEEFLSFYKQVDKSKYREAIFLYLLEDIRICCNI